MKYLTKKTGLTKKVSDKEIKHLRANEISIKSKKKMLVDSDGEVYISTPLHIKLINKKITFIVG